MAAVPITDPIGWIVGGSTYAGGGALVAAGGDVRPGFSLQTTVSGARLLTDSFEIAVSPELSLFLGGAAGRLEFGGGVEAAVGYRAAVGTKDEHTPVALRLGVGFSTRGPLLSAGIDVPLTATPNGVTDNIALSAGYQRAGDEQLVTLGLRVSCDLKAGLEHVWTLIKP